MILQWCPALPCSQVNFAALSLGTTLGSLLPSMWNRICILDKSGERVLRLRTSLLSMA